MRRWAVQGVILEPDWLTERGRYAQRAFRTRWAARRWQRQLQRDNRYPFRADLRRLS